MVYQSYVFLTCTRFFFPSTNVLTNFESFSSIHLTNNFKFKNTKVVWGLDYFRTEALTNGTVLNDGPNGYDNDGDSWYTGNDNIDNDRDSDDFSDWGFDGIGPYAIDEFGGLIIDNCSDCESIVNSQANNASYDSQYDLWFIDEDNDGQWTTNNDVYPYLSLIHI